MEKLTKTLSVPLNQDQMSKAIAAAEQTGMRLVDVGRYAIFEYLLDPLAIRYILPSIKLARGESAGRIQIPLTPLMFDRLINESIHSGDTPVDLARTAILDFAERHAPK